ncbi:hypothetical protein [Janthinobacterium sp. PC23-8]|uniref:hypothetical protein n=1 Tax=Janthinobacterium sp. PC23-8 TaxID=2012679 RepID=UPI0020CE9D12|nr:hypothetical protein [Janthinobacterium sp. PC23-8]
MTPAISSTRKMVPTLLAAAVSVYAAPVPQQPVAPPKLVVVLVVDGPRWIRPGAYGQYAQVVDIAPTLAHLLRVRQPSASAGRVLTQVLR